MDLDNLDKITAKNITVLSAAFVGGVVPGLVAIYFFKPAWLLAFDIPKLLFFSAAITMPVFVLNCYIIENAFERFDTYWTEKILFSSLSFTAVVCFVPLLMMYTHPSKKSFELFWAGVIGAETLFGVGIMAGKIKKYGWVWVVGGEETNIKNAVKKIIDDVEPGKNFDSHAVIEAVMNKYSNAYTVFMRGHRSSLGSIAARHGQISKMIAEYDGTIVDRVGDTKSQTIYGNPGSCALWKKKEKVL